MNFRYKAFSCHIPGCEKTFETIIQYESHYNSCHCFTCNECSKNFPNNHLLDLHLSESHDSFFIEQAKRKPMVCIVFCLLFKRCLEKVSHHLFFISCSFSFNVLLKSAKNYFKIQS